MLSALLFGLMASGALGNADQEPLAVLLSFAGGAWVALATAAGFLLSFLIAEG